MTKFNTGNAVPSTDARDLYDNAQNLDEAVNSDSTTFTDRQGKSRLTIQGMVDAATTGNPAVGAAQESLASADRSENEADRSQSEANRALSEADRAESAKDAAQLSSGVYADTASGLAATTVDDHFSTPSASGDEYLILYRHDSGPVATQISIYPSAGAVRAFDERLASHSSITNLIDLTRGAGIFNYTGTTGVSVDLSGGVEKVVVEGPGTAELAYTEIPIPSGESTLFYNFALREKIGSDGKVSIIQYSTNDSPGEPDSGAQVASTDITLPAGGVSEATYYNGSVSIDPTAVRALVFVRTETTTKIAVSELAFSFRSLSGYIQNKFKVNEKIAQSRYPFVDSFEFSSAEGLYDLATLARTPDKSWQITDNHKYRIVDAGNLVTPTGYSLSRGAGWEYEAKFEIESDSSGTSGGIIMCFGDTPAGLLGYIYLQNGFIGTIVSDGSVSGSAIAGMNYTAGQPVTLKVVTDANGDGYILATSPDGTSYTETFTGLPAGKVWIGSRSPDVNLYHYFRAVPLTQDQATSAARLTELESIVSPDPATFSEYSLLPDSVASRDPKGFTCTGIDKITRGQYAGCWIVADDGRLTDDAGDSSPFAPAAHIITPDFRQIIKTISFSWNHSAQGVAVDTSGSIDTFWVASAGDGFIRHFDLNGAEITGDAFDWVAAGYTGNPNALAYDSVNDALWAAAATDATAYLVSCDPAASPRQLDTKTLSNSPDHFHYRDGVLFYTTGGNGSDGSVWQYDVNTDTESSAYGPLQYAQAIEGVYLEPEKSELIVMSDGGYHLAASPQLNIAIRYRCKV